MKLINKMLLCFLTPCLIISFSVPAFASEISYKNYKSLYDSEEAAIVHSQISNPENAVLLPPQGKSDNNKTEYKIYGLKLFDFAKEIKNGVTISELLSDDYAWIVLCGTGQTRIKKIDGKWQILGSRMASPNNRPTTDIDTEVFERLLASPKFSGENEPVQTAFIESFPYNTVFAYIRNNTGEYLVPFSSRPDFTGLENGKLYTTAEVAEILPELIEGDENGGAFFYEEDFDIKSEATAVPEAIPLPAQKTIPPKEQKTIPTAVYVAALGTVITACTVTAVVLIKRKKAK